MCSEWMAEGIYDTDRDGRRADADDTRGIPRRDSMKSFRSCLMLSIKWTCLITAVSSWLMGRLPTTGEIDFVALVAGVQTSVLIGCEMPIIVM